MITMFLRKVPVRRRMKSHRLVFGRSLLLVFFFLFSFLDIPMSLEFWHVEAWVLGDVCLRGRLAWRRLEMRRP